MGTFLYIALGVVLGIILVPVVLWVFFKFFFKGLVNRFVLRLRKKLAEMGGLFPPVPPFRVHLDETSGVEWMHGELMDQATGELETLGYHRVGDFNIREHFQIRMRSFVNQQAGAYAVLYDFDGDDPGVIVDMVAKFSDDSSVTCSNARIEGLREPPWETKYLVNKKTQDGAIADVAAKLQEVTAGREFAPVDAEGFVKFFEDTYARKMDWIANRGGYTDEELIQNLVATQGIAEDEIDPQVIELTQSQWRSAIAQFISEKTRERFLRHVTKMSASQWEDVRDRLFIVHDRSVSSELIEELKDRLLDDEDDDEEDDDAYERREAQVESQLKPHFDGHAPREAFQAAQSVLPSTQRYKRIARITGPWPADVYVEPAEV